MSNLDKKNPREHGLPWRGMTNGDREIPILTQIMDSFSLNTTFS